MSKKRKKKQSDQSHPEKRKIKRSRGRRDRDFKDYVNRAFIARLRPRVGPPIWR